MPIFARTKLLIQENCFDFTGPEMMFKYRGPDPQLAYSKIKEFSMRNKRKKRGG